MNQKIIVQRLSRERSVAEIRLMFMPTHAQRSAAAFAVQRAVPGIARGRT